MNTRQNALETSKHWWLCENIIHHKEQVGLLRMDFPRVFVLIRDYGESYFASFDEFKQHIAELNFFNPKDREEANIDDLLTEAWNFLALFEEAEENEFEANNGYQDEF